jgi:hypothetical protein
MWLLWPRVLALPHPPKYFWPEEPRDRNVRVAR